MSDFWGYQLMVDAADCDGDACSDHPLIIEFCQTLRYRLTSRPVPPPEVLYFDDPSGDWSLHQVTPDLRINVYYCHADRELYLDLFSRKNYNSLLAYQTIREYFKPQSLRSHFMTRDARYYHRDDLE